MRDIFQLTDSEQLVAAEIKRLLAGYPDTREDLVKYIKDLNDPLLFTKLAYYNKGLFPSAASEQERTVLGEIPFNRQEPPLPINFIGFCETEEKLQSYWEELIPQQKLPSYPDFIWAVEKNYSLFRQLRANICLAESDKQLSEEFKIVYREKAAELGCFHAQFYKLNTLIKEFYTAPTLEDEAREKIFALALNIAQLHQSPGHLLLALAYFVVANCYMNRPKGGKEEYREIARFAYNSASLFFDYAQKLEPISQPAIHNSVPGHSFFTVIQDAFTRLDCSNVAALKEQLETAKAYLPQYSPTT